MNEIDMGCVSVLNSAVERDTERTVIIHLDCPLQTSSTPTFAFHT